MQIVRRLPRQQRNHATTLYVCSQYSLALRNHMALRDHLRANPSDAAAYSAVKKLLAQRFPDDIDRYVEGKTDFIVSILAKCCFEGDALDLIRKANKPQRD